MWLFSVHSATPPLAVVRKFIHLLDLGDGDIREEAELLRLREEVVRSIRFNRQLEEDLNLMDLKIGLLVRNKATLQVCSLSCFLLVLTKQNHPGAVPVTVIFLGSQWYPLSR